MATGPTSGEDARRPTQDLHGEPGVISDRRQSTDSLKVAGFDERITGEGRGVLTRLASTDVASGNNLLRSQAVNNGSEDLPQLGELVPVVGCQHEAWPTPVGGLASRSAHG